MQWWIETGKAEGKGAPLFASEFFFRYVAFPV